MTEPLMSTFLPERTLRTIVSFGWMGRDAKVVTPIVVVIMRVGKVVLGPIIEDHGVCGSSDDTSAELVSFIQIRPSSKVPDR